MNAIEELAKQEYNTGYSNGKSDERNRAVNVIRSVFNVRGLDPMLEAELIAAITGIK